MRIISDHMRSLLTQGGPFVGENRASSRLTVEPDFWLNTTSGAVGNRPPEKLPIRWWQRANNSQTEVEIPNIQQVTITSDLTQQAATLQVQIYNTQLDANGVMGSLADQLGEPGWFSWNRGSTAESQARWNHQTNFWSNILRENALIRVYQGYGGIGMSIPDAVNAGYLILKGVFLLDDPVIESNGILTLNGRDMAKLLIDQQTIPPVIPQAKYPMNYWGPLQHYTLVTDPEVQDYRAGNPRGIAITGFATMPAQNDYGSDGEGYRLFGSDGGVFDYGSATFYGSEANAQLDGPITAGDVTPSGLGYIMLGSDGGIFTFGDATFYGSGFGVVDEPAVSTRIHPSGHGYWIVCADGAVYAYGSASYFGGMNGHHLNGAIVDMAVTPSGNGYWLLGSDGGVFTFGDATFLGRPLLGPDGTFVSIEATSTGRGYWICTVDGAVFTFGDAPYFGGVSDIPLNRPICRIRKKEPYGGSDQGYWMCALDGGVFTQGSLGFHGSLPGDFTYPVYDYPDYFDYADIIKDLALWAGFWLQDPTLAAGSEPGVYGVIETTGVYDVLGPLGIDFFDKRPIIDVMTDIANLVGYIVRCDDVGSLRFQAPNIWSVGNFYDENGEPTWLVPQIDERITLSDYQMTQTDQELRSPIVVAVSDPYLWGGPIPGTNVTTFIPPYTPLLKGITKSAMFAVPLQVDAQDQQYFAELIALRIWLASRTGTVTAWCDPSICVGDQVQIWERQTGETNVHYVKAITTTHQLDSGKFEMQLTTNWLGSSGRTWAITSDLAGISAIMGGSSVPTTVNVPDPAGDSTFQITQQLASMMGQTGSPATRVYSQAQPGIGLLASLHILLTMLQTIPDNPNESEVKVFQTQVQVLSGKTITGPTADNLATMTQQVITALRTLPSGRGAPFAAAMSQLSDLIAAMEKVP